MAVPQIKTFEVDLLGDPIYDTTLTFSTNSNEIVIEGTVDTSTIEMIVIDRFGNIYSSNDTDPIIVLITSGNPYTWEFTPSLISGENTYSIQAKSILNIVDSPASLTILYQTTTFAILPPTGISIERFRDRVKIITTQNTEPEVQGYNFYASKDPAGGLDGYFRINTKIVQTADTFRDRVISTQEVIQETANEDGTITEITTTTDIIKRELFFAFHHSRLTNENSAIYPALNNDQFSDTPESAPLYYVITALAFDTTSQQLVESVFSSELSGAPLIINTSIRDLVPRTQTDVTRTLIDVIQRQQPSISVVPGSVTRDIHIDPPSNEFEQVYFLLDFAHRSQSFLTLIAIDDQDGDGISDEITDSSYKRALQVATGFADPADVQRLIDEQFDKLAGNSNTIRKGSEFAIGQLVAFATVRPTFTITIQVGSIAATSSGAGSVVQFVVTSPITVTLDDIDSYFNTNTRRYEFILSIRAVNAGASGNQVAGAIVNAVSGFPAGIQVTNTEATIFGQDQESNINLAERALLAFSSVDTGTARGYLAKTLAVQGVQRAKIIEAGDDLMMRDYDEVRAKHIGGKVDIYVQGLNEQLVTDTFAFNFIKDTLTFTVVGSPSNLRFITADPRITEDTPIFAVISATNLDNAFSFNVTGYTTEDYNIIKLNPVINVGHGVTSFSSIEAEVRFRSTNFFIFTNQPARAIQSVVGSVSGTIDSEVIRLINNEDPLLLGRSTIASDGIQINPTGGSPSGLPIDVVDESHVLTGQDLESLNNVGVDISTIVVTDLGGTIIYDSDLTLNPVPDYFIEAGDLSTPPTIARNPDGNISNGQEVLVDYTHEENFTVSYTINQLLQDVQNSIEITRHVTADVIVKETVVNEVDLEMTVVLRKSGDQTSVDIGIRTAISRFVNSKDIGSNLYQSDIVGLVEDIDGVDYVVLPLAKMVKADGSLILREPLDNDSSQAVTGSILVFMINQRLGFNTDSSGIDTTQHRGVFQDELPLELRDTYASLSLASGRAFIAGTAGDPAAASDLGIPQADTANRIFVSTASTDNPSNHEYTVSYIVSGETGTDDIEVAAMEGLNVGNLTITYKKP